jgi:chromosomal replication initiation ATPase DnaA
MTHIDPELLKPRDISVFKRAIFPQQSKQLADMSKRIARARESWEIAIEAVETSNEDGRKRALFQISAQYRIEEARAAMGLVGEFRSGNALSRCAKVVAIICAYFGFSEKEILCGRRDVQFMKARQTAYFLCREFTTASYPTLGKFFGGRHHTTIIHGVSRIAKLMDTDEKLDADIAALRLIIEPKSEMLEAAE